ncbi:hypothetical protein ACSFA3_17260 [Variovorax sp. RHLX14]|uniref:hypothetical protein n=1 Tax=Variovorax sp. RHLX14 TaxID=1259731 RepID=UPI003F4524A5
MVISSRFPYCQFNNPGIEDMQIRHLAPADSRIKAYANDGDVSPKESGIFVRPIQKEIDAQRAALHKSFEKAYGQVISFKFALGIL